MADWRLIVWPEAKPEPTTVQRLGRVLHWVAILFAAFWAMLAVAVMPNDGLSGAAIFLGVAVVFYMAGRGLRYILSAE